MRQPDDMRPRRRGVLLHERYVLRHHRCRHHVVHGVRDRAAAGGDDSLAVTIVIIVAVAVALLCLLIGTYLRLPAERRAAMWNARLEAIGAAPKATA